MSATVGAKTKGYLKVVETGEVRKFLFNPEGFSDSQNFNFAVINSPCASYPKFQYVGTSEKIISLPLFIYGDKSTVSSYLKFIESLEPKSRFSPPKMIIVAMGSYVKTCVITAVNRDFTDFHSDLSVKGANITLSLVEVR